MEKVAFFGGSFDPVHLGHLHLAQALLQKKKLDEVWFCPARISPHKLDEPLPTPIEHRLNMVRLAVESEPRYRVLDLEARRTGPSYTVDTIEELTAQEKQRKEPRKLFLIITEELLPGFFHWKDPVRIVELAELLVGTRSAKSLTPPHFRGDARVRAAIEKGWIPTDVLEISSTDIRQRIRNGLDCSQLVPKKVLDYIYQNQLYF